MRWGIFLPPCQETGEVVRITAPGCGGRNRGRSPRRLFNRTLMAARTDLCKRPQHLVSGGDDCARQSPKGLSCAGSEPAGRGPGPLEPDGKPGGPSSLADRSLTVARSSSRLGATIVTTGSVQQVIRLGRDVNLYELPIPVTRRSESVFHGAMLLIGDPHTGERFFFERFPVQVLDRARLAVHFPTYGSFADRLLHSDRQWPVAMVLGGDPLHALAAETRRWPGLPAGFEWDGCLADKGSKIARCRSHDLEIPAHAEWIIEGFLHPSVWKQSPLLRTCRR